jgi:hypothetical protein
MMTHPHYMNHYMNHYAEEPPRDTHECFVCGDTIDLSAQVCSRFCMRAMEQLTFLDSLDVLEAQVESPSHSDYASSTDLDHQRHGTCNETCNETCKQTDVSNNIQFKVVADQRAVPELIEPKTLFDYAIAPPRKSY